MPKASLSFKQGTIAIADLFFSNQAERKRRPVLVISNSDHNQRSEDVLVMKITSAAKTGDFLIPLQQTDLEAGKLKKPSVVQSDFLVTIQKNLLTREIGKISAAKIAETKKELKKLFGL